MYSGIEPSSCHPNFVLRNCITDAMLLIFTSIPASELVWMAPEKVW
jgi:hypothetical protein